MLVAVFGLPPWALVAVARVVARERPVWSENGVVGGARVVARRVFS